MPSRFNSQANSALILDNNSTDAVLLKHLLLAASEQELVIRLHHSEQGIFPPQGEHFDWVFVAEGYANTELEQLIQLTRYNQPHAKLILLAKSQHFASQPQQLILAAHAGLDQHLFKDSLSTESLQAVLKLSTPLQPVTQPIAQQTLTMDKQPLRQAYDIANPAPIGSAETNNPQVSQTPYSAKTSPVVITTPTTPPSSTKKIANSIGELELNDVSVGIMRVQATNNGFVYTAINPAAAKMEQLDTTKAIGNHVQDKEPHYENFELLEALNDTLSSGNDLFIRALCLPASNTTPIWRDYSIRETNRKAKTGEFLIEITDVSLQVAEEKKRHQQNSIWRDIVQSLPDYTALIDEDTNIIDLVSGEWNKVRTDALRQLPGQTFTSLLPASERVHCRELINIVLNTGKTQSTLFCLDVADGALWLESKFSLLRSDTNAQRLVLLTAHEVTEQQQKIAELHGHQKMINNLVGQLPFALAFKDDSNRYTNANPFFLDLIQTSKENIVGKTDTDLFGPENAKALATLTSRAQHSGLASETKLALSTQPTQIVRAIQLPLNTEDKKGEDGNDSDSSNTACLLLLPLEQGGTFTSNTIQHSSASKKKKSH